MVLGILKNFLIKGLVNANKNATSRMIWLHCVRPSLCTHKNRKCHVIIIWLVLKKIPFWPHSVCLNFISLHRTCTHSVAPLSQFCYIFSIKTAPCNSSQLLKLVIVLSLAQEDQFQNVVIFVISWKRTRKMNVSVSNISNKLGEG